MSEEKRAKEYHEYKLKLLDKIPYETSKNLSAESLVNMSIMELEKLDPHYKPPKEKQRQVSTPQEKDLQEIEELGNPTFKFDLNDPKFDSLSPSVKTIYKQRFESLTKGLDKELLVELPKLSSGKMTMKTIPVPETISYNPNTIVPIQTKKDFDTVDQEKKIKELRGVRDKSQEDNYKKDIEIQSLNSRIKALQKVVVKEKYGIG